MSNANIISTFVSKFILHHMFSLVNHIFYVGLYTVLFCITFFYILSNSLCFPSCYTLMSLWRRIVTNTWGLYWCQSKWKLWKYFCLQLTLLGLLKFFVSVLYWNVVWLPDLSSHSLSHNHGLASNGKKNYWQLRYLFFFILCQSNLVTFIQAYQIWSQMG